MLTRDAKRVLRWEGIVWRTVATGAMEFRRILSPGIVVRVAKPVFFSKEDIDDIIRLTSEVLTRGKDKRPTGFFRIDNNPSYDASVYFNIRDRPGDPEYHGTGPTSEEMAAAMSARLQPNEGDFID